MLLGRLALVSVALFASSVSSVHGFSGFAELFDRAQTVTVLRPAMECTTGDVCLIVAKLDAGIAISRSTDGGVTWDQAPDSPRSITVSAGNAPKISCAGARCMTVWREDNGARLDFATSDDAGATWSDVLSLPINVGNVGGTVNSIGLSCWVEGSELLCVLASTVNINDKPTIVIRFDGTTWVGLGSVASVASINRESSFGRVGCSPDGALCVTAFEAAVPNSNPLNSLMGVTRSLTRGVSWSAPQAVPRSARGQARVTLGEVARHSRPSVECLDALRCIVAIDLRTDQTTESEIEVSFTTDAGATWAPFITVATNQGRNALRPRLSCDSDGVRCVVAWEENSAGGLPGFSVTANQGLTWSAPANMAGGLNVGAGQTEVHNKPAPSCFDGKCAVVLESNEPGFTEATVGTLDLPVADVITASPTESPTAAPTATVTAAPTASPSASPTLSPSASPTLTPSASPSSSPTTSPTQSPTVVGETPSPTNVITAAPTSSPSVSPSASPSTSPTTSPSLSPTASPTLSPSLSPSPSPSLAPTVFGETRGPTTDVGESSGDDDEEDDEDGVKLSIPILVGIIAAPLAVFGALFLMRKPGGAGAPRGNPRGTNHQVAFGGGQPYYN